MTRLAALGCGLPALFALLWCLEPVAALTLPLLAQGAATGLSACLGSLGVGLGVGVALVAGGLALRLARPPVERPALLYPVEPVRYLGDATVIESEESNG